MLSSVHGTCSEALTDAGFVDAILRMLEAWVAANAVRPAGLKGLEGGRDAPGVPPIPRWVDALLLVVDACTHINWQPPPQLCASCAAKPVRPSALASPPAHDSSLCSQWTIKQDEAGFAEAGCSIDIQMLIRVEQGSPEAVSSPSSTVDVTCSAVRPCPAPCKP